VLDAASPLSDEDLRLLKDTDGCDRLVVLNKTDLPQMMDGPGVAGIPHDLAVSAETGEGIDALRERIAERAAAALPGDALLTQARHIDAARRAVAALTDMSGGLDAGLPLDFAAIDAREALAALLEITGESVEEAVVDAVFRDFCVGK